MIYEIENQIVLRALEKFYGIKDIDNFPETEINKIKQDIKELRKTYIDDICITPYEKEKSRKAYILAYYPYYVFQTRYTFQMLDKYLGNIIQNGKFKVACFCSGPGPEAIGIVDLLVNKFKEKELSLEILLSDLEEGWGEFKDFTFSFIQDNYKNSYKKLKLTSLGNCNVLDKCSSCSGKGACSEKLYQGNSVYYYQNMLNHIEDMESFILALRDKMSFAEKGSLFVFSDLNYKNSYKCFESIKRSDLGEVVLERSVPEEIKLGAVMPVEVESKIFDGTDGLIPKRYVRFVCLAIRKL